MAGIAIAAVIIDRLVPEQSGERAAGPPTAHDETVTEAAPAVTLTPAGTPAEDPRPSIAVLPFENRSRLEDDAFFVDGMHDDILTQLSKIAALKVISRTSVERFRDTELPIKEIGAQLGVTKIVEGGVQRAGDRVRINVQLIDAETDEHLWAESYDRELTAANIFSIQSEMALAISGALKTTLTPEEKKRAGTAPTDNLEAWEAYQLGKQRMGRRTSETLLQAEEFFRRALAIDPGFALAYVGLADTLMLQTFYGGAPRETTRAEAIQMAEKARALQPELAEAWASLANIAGQEQEFDAADGMFRRAVELNPNYATAHHWLSINLTSQGRPMEATEHARRAVELDPLSAVLNTNLAGILVNDGRFDEADTIFRKVIGIDPSMPWPYAGIASLEAYVRNDFASALEYQQKALELDPGGQVQAIQLAMFYTELEEDAKVERLVSSVVDEWPDHPFGNGVAAFSYLSAGDIAKAERHARETYEADPRSGLFVVRYFDIQKGDLATAIVRHEQTFPELLASPPRVDSANYVDAINLALVLQRSGKDARADALLSAGEKVIADLPRLGFGYGVADAQIHALRGETNEALAALREAVAAGWRGPFWRYYRDLDPTLESIRDEPGFKAVFADIEHDMARQREQLATNR